jgi:hypothetical protein
MSAVKQKQSGGATIQSAMAIFWRMPIIGKWLLATTNSRLFGI